jgi:hypothetical protein
MRKFVMPLHARIVSATPAFTPTLAPRKPASTPAPTPAPAAAAAAAAAAGGGSAKAARIPEAAAAAPPVPPAASAAAESRREEQRRVAHAIAQHTQSQQQPQQQQQARTQAQAAPSKQAAAATQAASSARLLMGGRSTAPAPAPAPEPEGGDSEAADAEAAARWAGFLQRQVLAEEARRSKLHRAKTAVDAVDAEADGSRRPRVSAGSRKILSQMERRAAEASAILFPNAAAITAAGGDMLFPLQPQQQPRQQSANASSPLHAAILGVDDLSLLASAPFAAPASEGTAAADHQYQDLAYQQQAFQQQQQPPLPAPTGASLVVSEPGHSAHSLQQHQQQAMGDALYRNAMSRLARQRAAVASAEQGAQRARDSKRTLARSDTLLRARLARELVAACVFVSSGAAAPPTLSLPWWLVPLTPADAAVVLHACGFLSGAQLASQVAEDAVLLGLRMLRERHEAARAAQADGAGLQSGAARIRGPHAQAYAAFIASLPAPLADSARLLLRSWVAVTRPAVSLWGADASKDDSTLPGGVFRLVPSAAPSTNVSVGYLGADALDFTVDESLASTAGPGTGTVFPSDLAPPAAAEQPIAFLPAGALAVPPVPAIRLLALLQALVTGGYDARPEVLVRAATKGLGLTSHTLAVPVALAHAAGIALPGATVSVAPSAEPAHAFGIDVDAGGHLDVDAPAAYSPARAVRRPGDRGDYEDGDSVGTEIPSAFSAALRVHRERLRLVAEAHHGLAALPSGSPAPAAPSAQSVLERLAQAAEMDYSAKASDAHSAAGAVDTLTGVHEGGPSSGALDVLMGRLTWPVPALHPLRRLYTNRIAFLGSLTRDKVMPVASPDPPGSVRKGRRVSNVQRGAGYLDPECTFAPLLCKKSLEIASAHQASVPVVVRNGGGAEGEEDAVATDDVQWQNMPRELVLLRYKVEADAKAKARRMQAAAKEVEECTFQPNAHRKRKSTGAYGSNSSGLYMPPYASQIAASMALEQQQQHLQQFDEVAGTGAGAMQPLSASAASMPAFPFVLSKSRPRAEWLYHLATIRNAAHAKASEAAAKQREDEELAPCTFKPRINPRATALRGNGEWAPGTRIEDRIRRRSVSRSKSRRATARALPANMSDNAPPTPADMVTLIANVDTIVEAGADANRVAVSRVIHDMRPVAIALAAKIAENEAAASTGESGSVSGLVKTDDGASSNARSGVPAGMDGYLARMRKSHAEKAATKLLEVAMSKGTLHWVKPAMDADYNAYHAPLRETRESPERVAPTILRQRAKDGEKPANSAAASATMRPATRRQSGPGYGTAHAMPATAPLPPATAAQQRQALAAMGLNLGYGLSLGQSQPPSLPPPIRHGPVAAGPASVAPPAVAAAPAQSAAQPPVSAANRSIDAPPPMPLQESHALHPSDVSSGTPLASSSTAALALSRTLTFPVTQPPLMYVDIAITPALVDRVPVWADTDLTALAIEFTARHDLAPKMTRRLERMLRQQREAVLSGQDATPLAASAATHKETDGS